MCIRWWFLALLGCWLAAAAAEPLYWQAVEQVRPDAETLAKAREKVEKHKDIVIRDDIDAKLPPFHRRPEKKVTKGETFCQICHLPLPHSKTLRTRSFLNMHSRFIACATCHFRPKDRHLDYRWLDYRTGKVIPASAERFRTGKDIDNSIPIDGWVKIAPFWGDEPVVPLPGDETARRIDREWREGDLESRARLQARLHLPLEEKGPECGACHQEEKPLLDLEALGAPRRQAALIYRHVIPQFFGRYTEEDQRIRILDITR